MDVEAIEAADDAAWTSALSVRELEIASLVARGFSNKVVARELGITEGTVKAHMHSILRKLGAASRYTLVHSRRRAPAQ